MRRSMGPHLLLALGALVLFPGPLPGAIGPDTQGEVSNVLRSRWADDDRTLEAVAAELAAIGTEAIPILVGLVNGTALPSLIGAAEESEEGEELDVSAWWRGPDSFGPVAFEALGLLPPRDVIAYLATHTDQASLLEDRLVAARILGRLSSSEGVDLLCELSSSCTDFELQYRSVRKPFEQAFASVLTKDPGSVDLLQRRCEGLPHDVQTILVDAIEGSERPEGFYLLRALVEGNYGPDPRVIGAVADLGDRFRWRLDDEPSTLLQLYLHHDDPEVRRSALVGLERLQDAYAFRLLITFLQDEAPAVRRTSLWVLRRLSNASLDADPVLWNRWLDEQERWWQREPRLLTAQLESGEPAEVLDAIRSFSERPFFRHEIALLITDTLIRERDSVKLVACDALRRLGSRAAVPALAEQLYCANEEVRQAAWKALRELTRKDLPLDAEAWSAYVEG